MQQILGLSAWLLGPALACSLNAQSLTRSAIPTQYKITLARSLKLILQFAVQQKLVHLHFSITVEYSFQARSLARVWISCVFFTLARSLWSREVVCIFHARSLARGLEHSCLLTKSQNSWMYISCSLAQWGSESYMYFSRSLAHSVDLFVYFMLARSLGSGLVVCVFHARSLTLVQRSCLYFSRSLARSLCWFVYIFHARSLAGVWNICLCFSSSLAQSGP